MFLTLTLLIMKFGLAICLFWSHFVNGYFSNILTILIMILLMIQNISFGISKLYFNAYVWGKCTRLIFNYY